MFNLPLYSISPTISIWIYNNYNSTKIDPLISIPLYLSGIVPAILETFFRGAKINGIACSGRETRIVNSGGKLEKRANASLIGKIISLPLEGILGVYDGIKEARSK